MQYGGCEKGSVWNRTIDEVTREWRPRAAFTTSSLSPALLISFANPPCAAIMRAGGTDCPRSGQPTTRSCSRLTIAQRRISEAERRGAPRIEKHAKKTNSGSALLLALCQQKAAAGCCRNRSSGHFGQQSTCTETCSQASYPALALAFGAARFIAAGIAPYSALQLAAAWTGRLEPDVFLILHRGCPAKLCLQEALSNSPHNFHSHIIDDALGTSPTTSNTSSTGHARKNSQSQPKEQIGRSLRHSALRPAANVM
jgi:hypothetical protein